jgi:flagellar motor switch protein FliM
MDNTEEHKPDAGSPQEGGQANNAEHAQSNPPPNGAPPTSTTTAEVSSGTEPAAPAATLNNANEAAVSAASSPVEAASVSKPASIDKHEIMVNVLDNNASKDFSQEFVIEFQSVLTSFLRKKVTVNLEGIIPFLVDKVFLSSESHVVLSFRLMPENQYGVVFFDFSLLSSVITLLYGGYIDDTESAFASLGKFGIRIAIKLCELALMSLQQSIKEHLNIEITFSEFSPQLYQFFNQDKMLQFVDFSLRLNYEAINPIMHIILPGHLFNKKVDVLNSHTEDKSRDTPDINPQFALDKLLKSELSDSVIDLLIGLPAIKLRADDVFKLQSGDIIPIGDPSKVLITFAKQKLFQGMAGQMNGARVVKITEKL